MRYAQYVKIWIPRQFPLHQVQGSHLVDEVETPLPHPLAFQRFDRYNVYHIQIPPMVPKGDTVRLRVVLTNGQTVSPLGEPNDAIVVPEPGQVISFVALAILLAAMKRRRAWQSKHQSRGSTRTSRIRRTTRGKGR